MAKQPIEKPYLEFKYKLNQMIGDLGDGKTYIIPVEMKIGQIELAPGNNPHKVLDPRTGQYVPDPSMYTTKPVFDLDKVHRMELKNELPIVPKTKPKGMSDAHYEKLCDRAYTVAAEAKATNDAIRAKLNKYVENGVIEVVSDPFLGEETVEGLEELADIVKAEKSEAAPEVKTRKVVNS